MASENEPAKLLLPYLQRADELQKHEPLVAYYCRLYAMERGLKIPQNERTKTTNALLISLMNQLEKDKKALKLGPEDHLHLEGFALNVFAKADKQDRAGRADLNTAKTFYAASIFFEILNQFGELQPDLEQKQKYAVWKAADIRKALKEGKKPQPGPPGDENDLPIPPCISSAASDLGSSETGSYFNPAPESDLPTQFYGGLSRQHSSTILPSHPPTNFTPPPPSTNIVPCPSPGIPPSPPTNAPPPPSYHSADYPSHDFHLPPPTNRSENSSYSEPYHHQPYSQEPMLHLPQNYPSHETPPSYSYPNFQSYPSFTESSLPSAPSHYPSYYQGSDGSYPPQSAPVSSSPSAVQYNSSSPNGAILEPAPTPTQTYQYDSNYQPGPEKIAEAHKAARFAVGALAFDDVTVAVEFLRKSLELLTNPSAGQ